METPQQTEQPVHYIYSEGAVDNILNGKDQPQHVLGDWDKLLGLYQIRLLKSINGKLTFFVWLAVIAIIISLFSALLHL